MLFLKQGKKETKMKTKSCENSMKIIKKHDEITCQTLAYMIKFICCKKTRM